MCEGLTAEQQPNLGLIERAGPAEEKFRAAVQKWCKWLSGYEQQTVSDLAIAETKPEKAQHRSGLYLDEKGQVWDNLGGERWIQLVRSSDELCSAYRREGEPYRQLDREISDGSFRRVELDGLGWVEFFARSDDDLDADWGWEIREPGSYPPPRPAVIDLRRSLERWQRGLDLADRILGCGNLTEFMVELAERQHEHRAEDVQLTDEDWPGLLNSLDIPRGIDVPDNGSVLCALHAAIDQVACGCQVRTYGY